MQSRFELIITADGSHTVRDLELDITYHSTHGAIQESDHVFIQAGLAHLSKSNPGRLSILEVGFGTGLNAFLSYQFVQDMKLAIDYTSLEPYPLPKQVIRALNYPAILNSPDLAVILEQMHDVQSGERAGFGEHFSLMLLHETLSCHSSKTPYDLVFFDAFGPAAAPDIWSLASLRHLRSMLIPGSTLVTFCAQGQFKRNLKALGFEVEALPGPAGKREMTRAKLL